MLFATVGDFFFQFFLFWACILGLIGHFLKKNDTNGRIKTAAWRAGTRGGVSLFKRLMK